MKDSVREQEYREEAERLALASEQEQAAALAWLRDIAADSKVKKTDREAAGERAKALDRLLKAAKKKGRK